MDGVLVASSVVLVEGSMLVSVLPISVLVSVASVVLVSTTSVVLVDGSFVSSVLASDAEVDSVVVDSTGCIEAAEVPPIPRYLI